jgi:hypothetical protein
MPELQRAAINRSQQIMEAAARRKYAEQRSWETMSAPVERIAHEFYRAVVDGSRPIPSGSEMMKAATDGHEIDNLLYRIRTTSSLVQKKSIEKLVEKYPDVPVPGKRCKRRPRLPHFAWRGPRLYFSIGSDRIAAVHHEALRSPLTEEMWNALSHSNKKKANSETAFLNTVIVHGYMPISERDIIRLVKLMRAALLRAEQGTRRKSAERQRFRLDRWLGSVKVKPASTKTNVCTCKAKGTEHSEYCSIGIELCSCEMKDGKHSEHCSLNTKRIFKELVFH